MRLFSGAGPPTPAIAKLLLFESSGLEAGAQTSVDEYMTRQKPTQEKIYYLLAPDRAMAEASPYYEAFKKSGTEGLFLYSAIDDFVMNKKKFFCFFMILVK